MVGVDPALVLCYRDEYHEILGKEQCQFTVMLAHEWLMTLPEPHNVQVASTQPWYFSVIVRNQRLYLIVRINGQRYLLALGKH